MLDIGIFTQSAPPTDKTVGPISQYSLVVVTVHGQERHGQLGYLVEGNTLDNTVVSFTNLDLKVLD